MNPPPRTASIGAGRATSVASRTGQRVVLGSLFGIIVATLLWPAVINGGPLLFPDSADYLLWAIAFRPFGIRPFGYSAFLAVSGVRVSVWLPIIAQAGLLAYVIVRGFGLLRLTVPEVMALAGAVVAALALGAPPWFTSWLMPDIMGPIGVGALALAALPPNRAVLTERLILFAAGAGCVTCHTTFPPLFAGLGAGAALVAIIMRRGPTRTMAIRLAVCFCAAGVLGGAVLVALTYRATGQLGLASISPVFLLARLQELGEVRRVLQPLCDAGAAFATCAWLTEMPMSVDAFLWDVAPYRRVFPEMHLFIAEASQVNALVMRQAWPALLADGLADVGPQLVATRIGQDYARDSSLVALALLREVGLAKMAGELGQALQPALGVDGHVPALPASILAQAGMVAVGIVILVAAARRATGLALAGAGVFLLIVGNALLIALGGAVHDRYHMRFAGLVPVAALLLLAALRQRARRVPREA